jgi:peptidoglycan hydrolase CwlO-like protein
MVAQQETQIAQKNRETRSLDDLFNRQVNVIEDLHETIDDKQETIERLNYDLDEWTREVDEQDIMIKSRNAEIRQLQNRIQELRNDLTNAETISLRRLKVRNDRIHELEIQLQAARKAANPNGL